VGVTRKFLSLNTLGLVDFRSDKERIARSTRRGAKQAQKQTKIMKKAQRAEERGEDV
jgi:hypothetical protein